MDKSYYDADFESVLKDFEKKGSLVKKGEAIEGKSYFKSAGQYPAVSNIPKSDTSTFLKRRLKLSGPIGAAATVGALAGVALEKGINKIKSMKGKDAKPTPSDVEGKAKGGMTKGQKKVGRVMREFKKGELHSGKKGPVVKNPKQAIAIALSEAGMSKPQKKQDGGMVRFKKQYQMHNGKF
jgi:hypothetical protein